MSPVRRLQIGNADTSIEDFKWWKMQVVGIGVKYSHHEIILQQV